MEKISVVEEEKEVEMNVATQWWWWGAFEKGLKARESFRELDRLACVEPERHWAHALVYVASHLSKRR